MEDQEAATVTRAFYSGWIARFGTPLKITTDQSRQFESSLFEHLCVLAGATHLRTTAYRPQANEMVERFHRQLKAAIKCYDNARWTETLPTVLLDIRTAWREDLESSAEMADYCRQLRSCFENLRPAAIISHGKRKLFVYKDLLTAEHVFVRHDAPKKLLQDSYDGPFKVIRRGEKTSVMDINGRHVKVSIDRLKPTYELNVDMDFSVQIQPQPLIFVPRTQTQQRSPVLPPPHSVQEELLTITLSTSPPSPYTSSEKINSNVIPIVQGTTTRSGRRVRFGDRFQAGGS
ncbi:PREDICTED: uncharacterized protein LOC108565493 [Nicrophorus vespilloides]|uniref:Uncharacterized protein LOC108565493 n=1 Tax=Nicrophorus vespilloides TaxID=110193 RepID=A0ABM1N0Y7_NICVS|nr:PREDICTED: uncharacterized protein LOC108565493 [Nicrophorus vespilloides]